MDEFKILTAIYSRSPRTRTILEVEIIQIRNRLGLDWKIGGSKVACGLSTDPYCIIPQEELDKYNRLLDLWRSAREVRDA